MGVGVIMPRQGEATELAGLVSEPGNQMGDGGTLSIWIFKKKLPISKKTYNIYQYLTYFPPVFQPCSTW
jgi:hypothetical protein